MEDPRPWNEDSTIAKCKTKIVEDQQWWKEDSVCKKCKKHDRCSNTDDGRKSPRICGWRMASSKGGRVMAPKEN